MRPANQKQAVQHLLGRKLGGRRKTRVKEHTNRAKRMAASIWIRFQVGPYQYRLKHLKWYLDTQTHHLTANVAYRHWLTTKNIVVALGKEADWIGQLQGAWTRPKSTVEEKVSPAKLMYHPRNTNTICVSLSIDFDIKES